jgi:preprotein translocase subunit YajC
MALTANTEAWLRWAMAAVAMAMMVMFMFMFKPQRSKAGTADRRP